MCSPFNRRYGTGAKARYGTSAGHYKFTHARSTTNGAHPYTENMVLIVGKNAAYKSYDAQLDNALF